MLYIYISCSRSVPKNRPDRCRLFTEKLRDFTKISKKTIFGQFWSIENRSAGRSSKINQTDLDSCCFKSINPTAIDFAPKNFMISQKFRKNRFSVNFGRFFGRSIENQSACRSSKKSTATDLLRPTANTIYIYLTFIHFFFLFVFYTTLIGDCTKATLRPLL